MAYQDDLITRRDKAAAKLAQLDVLFLDYPNAPGEVDYEQHKRGLWDEIERLNALIAQADGAYEINSQLFS